MNASPSSRSSNGSPVREPNFEADARADHGGRAARASPSFAEGDYALARRDASLGLDGRLRTEDGYAECCRLRDAHDDKQVAINDAVAEVNRRRRKQRDFNERNGIVPVNASAGSSSSSLSLFQVMAEEIAEERAQIDACFELFFFPRKKTARAPPAASGWNQPCGCGSGRKYKLCCASDAEREARRKKGPE